MSWTTWKYGSDWAARQELEEDILCLMRECAFELDDPDLDEWFEDAGIEVLGTTDEGEDVLVYYEIQEERKRPGYTLTYVFSDGQQCTEAFYADDEDAWDDIASAFVDQIIG